MKLELRAKWLFAAQEIPEGPPGPPEIGTMEASL